MSNLVLSLLIPVALVVGAALGVMYRVLAARVTCLERLSEPDILRRIRAQAWDDGWQARDAHVWQTRNPHEEKS